MADSVAGHVFRTRQGRILGFDEMDALAPATARVMAAEGVRSFCAMPLIAHGEALGVLTGVIAKGIARGELRDLPPELVAALKPVLETIASLTATIRRYEEQLSTLAGERYPETAFLRQVHGVGLLTAIGQYAIAQSLRFAQASILAPIDYSTFFWVVALDFFWWDKTPAKSILAGAAIIVGSNLFILFRARREEAAKKAALATEKAV